jgi:hypothetical protein
MLAAVVWQRSAAMGLSEALETAMKTVELSWLAVTGGCVMDG